jgi:integrase
MLCIASLGLRAGELLGLRTTSIKFDDEKKSAEIIIDLQRNRFNELGAPLKTKDSYRNLWVNGEIVDVLKYSVMYSNNIRKANFISLDATPWLWVNQYGAPVNTSALSKITSKVSSGTDIRITPHMLRHFFATQAIASNAPAIDVMHWLGHSSVQMTADYTRQTKEAALNVYDGFNGTW